jgi:phosphoglycolate phosphatase
MSTTSPFQHICFDLDGTLTDSIGTIYMSTIKTLEKLKIPNDLTIDVFRTRIGHHFLDMFKAFNITVPDFEEYITIYKNHYFDFIDRSTIYPGVIETLQYLKDRGIKTSLCTTKLQSQADKAIDYFGIGDYFSMVLGRRDNMQSKPSAEPLVFICKELNVSPQTSIIVGDTELDIRCGKNAGSKTCAVSYGYRELDLIKEENPDYIINDITELKNIAY